MSGRRIAYLTGEYPRATDTFIQREVAALRASGVEVDTFAVRRTGPEHMTGPEQIEAKAATTYLLDQAKGPGLLSAHLKTLLRSPSRFFSALALARATKRAGLKGGLFQLIYFAEAVVLADQLAKRNITHLHNHFGDSSCTVAMLASEVSGVPYSFTLHGSGIFFEAHTWRLDQKLDRAAFTACISHFTRSQASVFAAPETLERLHIVHCGIEPERLDPVEHSGTANRMMFVGRVIEAKGLTVLFEAMKSLTPSLPNLTLTVVGDGPDRSRLESRARSMGLGDRVEFVGAKSQSEVAKLLSSAEIFVLPSFAEGVPVVIMEALGSGVPVVASFVGGIPELIEHDKTGFLVRPGDPVRLAEHIEALATDPDLRNRLGRAGRAKVEAEFNSTTEAAKLDRLFEQAQTALGSGGTPTLPE